MNKCPNCGKELETGVNKCPDCGNEIVKENNIEEVQVNPNNIISFDEEFPKEESVESNKQPEIVSEPLNQPEENTNQTSTEEKETIEQETIVVNETPAQEEPSIVNTSLETVSIDATNITLEEEKKEEIIIEVPDMPEPTIAEINPDLLGSTYDEAERINNEKIEAKRQAELAELERKRQEEEARRQALAQAGKPDLLAGRNNGEIEIEEPKKKHKKGKIGKIILILLILIAIAFAAYYFLVLGNK